MIDVLSERNSLSSAARIVRTISAQGTVTAGEIARQTGLARSTISTALTELRDVGVVIERDVEASAQRIAGRPVKRISLNPKAGTALGLHLGLAEIDLALLDVAHNVIGRHRIPLRRDYSPRQAAKAALTESTSFFKRHGLPIDGLIGVGLSVSGPVSPDGRVLRSSILPKWAGVNASDVFSPVFERPVSVENEANCAALAEMMWGAARGQPDFMMLKLGLGVGGALVQNGRLLTGAAGGAGEFGHICLVPNGELCRCGNRGCLETIASFERPLAQLARHQGRDLDLDAAIALGREGDAFARDLISESARHAGWGLAVLCTALNPPLVLIGGVMAQAGELLMHPLRESFERHVMIKSDELPDVFRTRLVFGDFVKDDSLRGAAGLVLQSIDRIVKQQAS